MTWQTSTLFFMVKYWMLSSKTTNKLGMSTFTTSINILLEILDVAIRKDKEIKGIQMRNEVNMSLFTDDMIVNVEELNEPSKKPL